MYMNLYIDDGEMKMRNREIMRKNHKNGVYREGRVYI